MSDTAPPPVTDLAGLFVPLITPFSAAGEVAAGPLERLARRVLDQGAAGLVALGTTAEATTLTEPERRVVLDVCARVCRERGAPLIAGAGSNDTSRSAQAVAALAEWPEVRAALVVVPYYSRPGADGVLAHFSALAASSHVPLVVYNIPYRTGQQLGWQDLLRLADLPGIVAVKHAVGCIDADTVLMMAELTTARLPVGFTVLAGDDLYAPALLALGAGGAILASAHLCTAEYARLVGSWRAAHAAEARDLGHRLAPLSRRLFAEPNPAVIKAALHRLGEIPSPAVRLPLLPARTESADAAIRAAAAAVPNAAAGQHVADALAGAVRLADYG